MLGTIAWRKATILSAAAKSGAVEMIGRQLVAIFQAADTEGVAFGLEASHDGGTTYTDVFNVIQEATGAAPVTAAWEVAKSATVAQYLNLPDAFRVTGPTHIKIESQDGSAAASNQNADTTIWLGFVELPDPSH